MKIYSLSKVVALPIVGILVALLVTTFDQQSPYSVYIFIPVFLLVALFIFHGPLDHWWLERHPIPLDHKIREWLIHYSTYYRELNANDKVQFENRLGLYVEGREFKSVGSHELKEVPYDVKHILASQAVMLTMNRSDYLLGDYDRVYLYKHPFPTPLRPTLHTVEVNHEDGLILLSTQEALPGIAFCKEHYNIALHAYAEAFIYQYSHLDFPTIAVDTPQTSLEEVLGIEIEKVFHTVGYKCELLPIHVVAYFQDKTAYKAHFPQEYSAFQQIFT